MRLTACSRRHGVWGVGAGAVCGAGAVSVGGAVLRCGRMPFVLVTVRPEPMLAPASTAPWFQFFISYRELLSRAAQRFRRSERRLSAWTSKSMPGLASRCVEAGLEAAAVRPLLANPAARRLF